MKLNLLKSFYFCTILAVLLANQNLINWPTGCTELLMLVYILLSSYRDHWKITIRDTALSRYVWYGWIVPSIVIWIYSIVIQLLLGFSTDYLVHTTTYCIRTILYTLFAVINVKVHKRKTVDLFLGICVIAYIPAWIKFFLRYGVVGGFMALLSGNIFSAQIALEVHTLTYLLGFVYVYYFYQWRIQKKPVRSQVILSLFMTVAGVKRIVMAAILMVSLVILVISFLREKTRLRWLKAGSVVMVFVALGYVYSIKSGILESVLQMLDIDDNFRFNFWNHFSSRYSLSPLFVGYGISYPHRILHQEWSQIQDLNRAANIHNDVLGFYLGLGFCGFVAYWWLFFCKRVQMLEKRISVSSAAFSIIISLFYFIIMMTSNEGMMEFPHAIYFLMIYMTACYDEDERVLDRNMGRTI